MGRKLFFTGYPGFIARWLVRSILSDDPQVEITFLVQEKFRKKAADDISILEEEGRVMPGRLRMVTGDVTHPSLGLQEDLYRKYAAETTEVWHLAGAFDLNVPEGVARKVNYWGTRHVVNFCRSCDRLDRMVHFSSVVVHAERQGVIREEELDEGQELVNNYFATKFWGEVEVRRSAEDGLPVVIIRPAGVLGDSRTGETDKFDNVYDFFRMAHLVKRMGLPPFHLGGGDARPNFIPVDYLADASAWIGRHPEAVGKCFHVVDPDPPTFREWENLIWRLVAGKEPRFQVPTRVVDWSARRLDWAWRAFRVHPDAVTYLNHVGLFDDSNTRRLLQGTGIACPPVYEYLPRLHDWWLKNRRRPGMEPKY
jgi:thioester reductase-like protein